MTPGRLVIDLRTHAPLQGWETGLALLSPLFVQPALKPDRAAVMGEVTGRHGLPVDGLSECAPLWGMDATLSSVGVRRSFHASFHWQRKGRKASTGQVTFPGVDQRGKRVAGGLSFEARFWPEIDWLALFCEWCAVMSPFAAMLHPAMDLEPAVPPNDPHGIAAIAARQFLGGKVWCDTVAGALNSRHTGLTNLGWATYLGGELAPEVNAARIIAAGFDVERVGDGCMIRTSAKPGDVSADFADFQSRRRRLRSCFRTGLLLAKD